jgi:hypothetical protein
MLISMIVLELFFCRLATQINIAGSLCGGYFLMGLISFVIDTYLGRGVYTYCLASWDAPK